MLLWPWSRTADLFYRKEMNSEIEKTSLSNPDKDAEDASILVADDDDVIRSLIRTLLEKAGYSVVEAVDGSEAVNKFRDHREEIDLLLLDVRMPVKDGKQAYEEIRQIRPDVKVLFISGYGSDVLEKYGVGGKDFEVVSKPFAPADLIFRIKHSLENSP